jgi:hypothetical protein
MGLELEVRSFILSRFLSSNFISRPKGLLKDTASHIASRRKDAKTQRRLFRFDCNLALEVRLSPSPLTFSPPPNAPA